MKILYIVTQADGGGAQKYVLTLAKHFHGEIAAGEGDELFLQAEHEGIKAYKIKHLKRNLNLWHDAVAIIEIFKLIKKSNPDIVHLNSSKAGLLGSIAAKLAGAKVIFTAHGFFFFDNTPFYIKWPYIILERFASLFRDFIIAVSDHDRLNAIKYKIISPDKIQTIHNGLPRVDFLPREDARAKLDLKDEFVIGNIAQYYHRKGLDVLVRAISLLPTDTLKKIKVVLIGDGPEKENLTKQIQELKLTDQIKLTGNIPEAARLMKAFDLFLLSSRVEGFPFALLEALQANLPIVATDVGGNKEAIGVAGIIIPSEDEKKLSEAIEPLIGDGTKREIFRTRPTSTEFTEDKMITQTQQIYDEVNSNLNY